MRRAHAKFAPSSMIEPEDLAQLKLPVYGQPPVVSPDGRRVAHVTRTSGVHADDLSDTAAGTPSSFLGTELWITDLEARSSERIGAGGSCWRPSWSPDSSRLAFYSDADRAVNVWVWEADQHQSRKLADDAIYARDRDDVASWSPDGSLLFAPLRRQGWRPERPKPFFLARDEVRPKPDVLSVDVFTSPIGNESLYPGRGDSADDFISIGVIEVATGRVERIADGFPAIQMHLSPDGRWLALLGPQRILERPLPSTPRTVCDLHVVSSDGGEPVLLAKDIDAGRGNSYVPPWAPDSSRIAYFDDDELWTANPGTAETARLSSDVRPIVDLLMWTPDSRSLFFFETHDPTALQPEAARAWLVPVEGAQPIALPEEHDTPRPVVSANARQLWSPDGTSILLSAQHRATKDAAVWRLWLDGEKPPELVWSAPKSLSDFGAPESAPGPVVFMAEDEACAPELWTSDASFEAPAPLTDFNAHVTRKELGRTRLIPFTSHDGEQRFGSLLMPPEEFGTCDLPVVFEIYPVKLSRVLHRWNPAGGIIPHQMLASRGYAVFLPDIDPGPHIFPTDPLAGSIVPALDELVRLGIADPERAGVMGQSAGGWSTNQLITETTRFAAAVTAAGPSNLTSMFGELAILASGAPLAYGQALMEGFIGAPPWEKPLQYLEKSPVFHLDKVETPLLLLHGTLDFAVDRGQPAEMFVGLRRLGKKAVFARYRGEGHVPGHFSAANRRDVFERVIAWFDEHLRLTHSDEATGSGSSS